MSNSLRRPKLGLAALLMCSLLTGCWERRTGLSYLGEETNQYYRDYVSNIEFSNETQELPEQVVASAKPRTISDRTNDEVWDMPLAEAIVTAIENNRVIRSDASFLSAGNAIFNNPDRVSSVYDPAIQESGVLFGGRGVEAALAAFDARWDTQMLWGRNSFYNNSLSNAGSFTTAETATFNTQLTKAFGYGGQVNLGHNVDYLGSNSPDRMFPSEYRGSISAEYRQPLLAGAGAEFTRIAGPITQSFGGITGVSQGVVIARINNDITVADLENNVRNLVLDVEQLYWELYLAYVEYETAAQTQASAQRTWLDLKIVVEGGAQRPGQPDPIGGEKQARDAYYASRVAVEQTLSRIYERENRLRRLLGLQVNDGRIIRPSDEPMTAEYIPDWYDAIADGLTHRVELRRQKWNIKSLELQLTAAKSLTQPRLDFVTGARLNGLGDDLFGDDRADGISGQGLDNLYGSIAGGNTPGWSAGVEMSIPVGFRSALAQVRNYELRLSKAREVLSVQEMEISHEIAASMQEMALAYQNMKTLYNRRIAAKEFVRHQEIRQDIEGGSTDLLLRAIANRAEADLAYFRSLVLYNQALARFQDRKGTLLEYNNVYLAEDHWDPAAYNDALRRAQERGHAIEDNLIEAKPAPFSMGPINPQPIELRQPVDETDSMIPMPEELHLPPAPGNPALVPPSEEETQARPYDETNAIPAPPRKTLPSQKVSDSQLLSRSMNRLLMQNAQRSSESKPTKPAGVQPASHESLAVDARTPQSVVSTPAVRQVTHAFGTEPAASSGTQPAAVSPAATKIEPLPQWPGTIHEAKVQPPAFPYSTKTRLRTRKRTPQVETDAGGEWYPLNLK